MEEFDKKLIQIKEDYDKFIEKTLTSKTDLPDIVINQIKEELMYRYDESHVFLVDTMQEIIQPTLLEFKKFLDQLDDKKK